MNRTTMITALACGLLLAPATAAPAMASSTDNANASIEDSTASDTLLINGRAYQLD